MDKQNLLLHICCAPCSTHVIRLLKEDFNVTAYFYNPNIHPKKEYLLRLEALKKFAERTGLKYIEGLYDTERWFKETKGYEAEPEGGKRCEICYRLRVGETARFAKGKFEWFATTLTVSPHKNAKVINSIGEELADRYGLKFYAADFKKKDGFKKSVQLSKEHNLYRQSYCGCVYSFV